MSGDQLDFLQGNRETLTGTLHDPAATTGHVLTVQADKSIAAQAGGGGSGGVQTVTVPVSSAQILDLANTPVVLIPGVPGSVPVVNGAALVYLAGAIPYLDGGGSLAVSPASQVYLGGEEWAGVNGAGFWDQVTDQRSVQGYGSYIGPDLGVPGEDTVIGVNGGASPTLGDGTLLVTLSYFLAPTV